jgi:hypothetical protein
MQSQTRAYLRSPLTPPYAGLFPACVPAFALFASPPCVRTSLALSHSTRIRS